MNLRKCHLLAAVGLAAASSAGLWADPPRTPFTPAPIDQTQHAPPPEMPLRPTDRRLPGLNLSPAANLVILAVLCWWLWRMHRRRRREESLFTASYYDRLPVAQMPLRTVTYPSDAHAAELRRYRDQWIEEFKNLQIAWSNRDLRSVTAIVGPDVLKELEANAPSQDEPTSARVGPATAQIRVDLADPADTWREEGKEFVTVHFAGVMKDAKSEQRSEFDEFWTFRRVLNDSGTEAEKGTLWIVTAIRRGNRERTLPRLAGQRGG